MLKEHAACYEAVKSNDTRFDGRFFVGVTSTGIYCRPVCRAKLPKAENCVFFGTAAEAEQAGFRPCLQCRPELAPASEPEDASAPLAHQAARLLEENCGSPENFEELARKLGCTTRHLRRVFAAEFHVSPVQYVQTCRLLLAKSLLTDTSLPMLDVAMSAGFGSLRRFNDLFKKRYGLAPGALRKRAGVGTEQIGNGFTLTLGYRPPYQWQKMLDFLALRAISGVEAIRDGAYCRTVRLVTREQKRLNGWIHIGQRPRKNVLTVTAAPSLLSVLPQLLARVRHLFDLSCAPDVVYESLASMNAIHPGLCVPGTRLPGCFDPYEMMVRAVLGQQITVKAAGTLAGRLVAAFGDSVETGMEGLTHTFPAPETILALDGSVSDHLGPLGITGARAKAILALSGAITRRELDFSPGALPEAEMKKLMDIPGIGAWTAQYIAMRAMGWADAFPDTDHGVKKRLRRAHGKKFWNWRKHGVPGGRMRP